MSPCKIIKQMGKVDLENRAKFVTLKKWLIATLNCRHYGQPFIAPYNLGANLTSFEGHEPLSHTHDGLPHQTNED